MATPTRLMRDKKRSTATTTPATTHSPSRHRFYDDVPKSEKNRKVAKLRNKIEADLDASDLFERRLQEALDG